MCRSVDLSICRSVDLSETVGVCACYLLGHCHGEKYHWKWYGSSSMPNPCSAEASAWHTHGSQSKTFLRVCSLMYALWSQKPLQHHFLMLKFILSKEKVRKKKAGVLEITLCKFQGLKMTSWRSSVAALVLLCGVSCRQRVAQRSHSA